MCFVLHPGRFGLATSPAVRSGRTPSPSDATKRRHSRLRNPANSADTRHECLFWGDHRQKGPCPFISELSAPNNLTFSIHVPYVRDSAGFSDLSSVWTAIQHRSHPLQQCRRRGRPAWRRPASLPIVVAIGQSPLPQGCFMRSSWIRNRPGRHLPGDLCTLAT